MLWRSRYTLIAALMIVAIAAALPGCGYHLSGQKTALPKEINSIAVVPFENQTLEPDLGAVVAEAMQREILKRGMIKLVSPGKADAVMRGKVKTVLLYPQSYDTQGFTSAYRVRMVVSVKLDRGGETVWSVDKLVRDEEIDSKAYIPDNYVRRTKALQAICEDIAEQIHIMMIEGW